MTDAIKTTDCNARDVTLLSCVPDIRFAITSSVTVIDLWNALPEEVDAAKSVKSFRNRLRKLKFRNARALLTKSGQQAQDPL